MRAVVWAGMRDQGEAYAWAAFRAAFVHGRDLGDPVALADVASEVGLPAADLPAALQDPAVKDALRASTQHAIELGVRGVPTLATADGTLLFGDDRLEEAAR
jgi:2-hydroxychromene-2-carboxylate isomerase